VKPLLRLIKGGKAEKMKFASFGRERDLEMIELLDLAPETKQLRIAQCQAAHDLNEGSATAEDFVEASRNVIFGTKPSERESALFLLSRIARYHPECLIIWDELANDGKWQLRFETACRLYWYIPENKSDRLFNKLRNDRSLRVREIAISRYSHRANNSGEIQFDVYDPANFDDRVNSGDVQI
jgi:hypothetical protein